MELLLDGYLVYDANKQVNDLGILVVHEWWDLMTS